MANNCAVILAAGEGTRMKSTKPKVLSELLFKPMIDYVIESAKLGGAEDICAVTGHMGESLNAYLGSRVETVTQSERLGTGHAVYQAKDFLVRHENGNVLVLAGDAPLMDSETIANALNFHERNENAVTVISARIDNPTGYGRIIRDKKDFLQCIVEEKEATDAQKAINEVNSGAYWFNCQALLTALEKISQRTVKKKEFYLTDAVEVLVEMGQKATAISAKTPDVILGANDRIQLMELNEIARKKVLEAHMKNGVSIPCPDGIIIGTDVAIAPDAVILPGTIIKGHSIIGIGSVIGPNSYIDNSKIGEYVTLNNTFCYSSEIDDGCEIGPYVRIRPGTSIDKNCRVGNFVELKNSTVGEDTKISHLSYIGDSDLGSGINVGCGVATVNFDGQKKHRTIVGNDAFIGCNNSLVAPVIIGDRAYTAAGSTITEDVPADALALARTRQIVKKDWVKIKNPYRK